MGSVIKASPSPCEGAFLGPSSNFQSPEYFGVKQGGMTLLLEKYDSVPEEHAMFKVH